MPQENKLLFLSNELASSSRQFEMGLPLEFVTFAILEGKMYKHYRNQSTFVLTNQPTRENAVVYGAIYYLNDWDFYMRILDAYNLCSFATLHRNHKLDVHHRVSTIVTPISFSSIEELATLRYKEREPVEVQTYLGNPNHPKITQRLNKSASYRVIDGITPHVITKIREELQ